MDRGALAWPDEHLYNNALSAAAALTRGDMGAACGSLNEWGARPAEHMVRLPAALLQLYLESSWGLPVRSPASLRLATIPNVAFSFLLGVAFYRLAFLTLARDGAAAAVASVAFSGLASNHVWIRHIVPYDSALCMSVFALVLGLRLKVDDAPALGLRSAVALLLPPAVAIGLYPIGFYSYRQAGLGLALHALLWIVVAAAAWMKGMSRALRLGCVTTGALCGLALATYPAYYSFHFAVPVIVALGGGTDSHTRLTGRRLRVAVAIGLVVAVVLFSFEVIARCGGLSYLGGARLLSQTITQGSFEEGYVFLPKYLLALDRPLGGLLLVLAAVFVGQTVWRLARHRALLSQDLPLLRCVLVFSALYVVYATQSVVFQRMTFTGRYGRMYIPFVVLAAVASTRVLPFFQRLLGWGMIVSVAASSFLLFAREYNRVAYPVNVLHELGIGFEDVAQQNRVYESNIVPNYNLPTKVMTPGAAYVTAPNDRRFVLVNFGWFDLEGHAFSPYTLPPGAQLLFRAPHFQCFRSSGFEAYGTERRKQFRDAACQLEVYRVPEGG